MAAVFSRLTPQEYPQQIVQKELPKPGRCNALMDSQLRRITSEFRCLIKQLPRRFSRTRGLHPAVSKRPDQ